MKRFAFLGLILTFAAATLVSAEEQNGQNGQNTRGKKAAAPNGHQVSAPQQFQRPINVPRNNNYQAQQFQNTARNNAAVNSARLKQAAVLNAQKNAQINAAANANAQANWRNWRNRQINGNTNGAVNKPNAGWNDGDNSGSDRDWQNRQTGDNITNRTRWTNYENWDRHHRSRSWWRSHYSRFATFGGGYYYWNNGYWYPAYGYNPYFSTYSYDAPIYAYNDQDPGQVIADVQTALARRGYDVGYVDGTYGPLTRRALLNFQRDNGLPVTGVIDQPTLESLGFR